MAWAQYVRGRIVSDRVFTHPLSYKRVDWNAASIGALELAAFAFLRALTADLLNLSPVYSLSIWSFQSAFKHVCDTSTLKHFLFHSQSLLKLQKRVVNTYSFFPFPFALSTLQYVYHPNPWLKQLSLKSKVFATSLDLSTIFDSVDFDLVLELFSSLSLVTQMTLVFSFASNQLSFSDLYRHVLLHPSIVRGFQTRVCVSKTSKDLLLVIWLSSPILSF